ncbi:MAG: vitamin B12-dependent ribonucleotide reductase [Bdellovibrionales bacterium]
MTELKRHFSRKNESPYDRVTWKKVKLPIFEHEIEAPEAWSDTAIEIAATKYFRRKAGEKSVRQLFSRVVHAIRKTGEAQGYFSGEQAEIFADELTHILLHQMGSFNSPVYFNVGIFEAYGSTGSAENFVWDQNLHRAVPVTTAYVNPQASACFIQSVKDDLLGIFDLLKNEAKLFKYGSGTGTNFSSLRAKGEPLEGGGESTGLLSYLEVFDKAAQAIKSGGTTRRAAKMVVLDADHPEILEFVRWKMFEERKARVLLANGYSGGMEGEAYRTVSGQNSNNSVRVTDDFLNRVADGKSWALRNRCSGKTAFELPAKEILREMARAAWECADPGIQFHDTIQKWHMCAASGEIRSSNPCSEYMFLDDSACNLASLNLVRFLKGQEFDWQSFAQGAQILLLAQDILVDYAAYPTKEIAENSHCFRPLGLGYANLGGMLMRLGIPYDSELGAEWTARITGAMHAMALSTSQLVAETMGAFEGWEKNRESAMQVLKMHQAAWRELGLTGMKWVDDLFSSTVAGAARTGLRNAQVTLIAPTGTIGLLMDCDTLGIEPDFSLIKIKTLAGGGALRLVNQGVSEALRNLKYSEAEITKLIAYVTENGSLAGAPELRPEHAAVFDCALPPIQFPERRVSPEGHLRIMAAAQPFLSGAISKTVNLPTSFTVDDVEKLFLQAWKLGLKSLAIYRDGSKALQPLCAEC